MKSRTRFLSFILTVFILLGMIPTVFAEGVPAAVDENFDKMTQGREPTGWSVEPIGRNDASIKVVAAPKNALGGNAMRIEDNSSEYANPTIATKTFSPTDEVVLSFDYYMKV